MAGPADDREATRFGRIAVPHLDAALRLARWLVRDPARAEDVAQEAMLRALTYFSSFRGENPRAWLLQIVRTTALTHLGQDSGRREDPLDADGAHADLPSADPGPEARLAGAEQHTLLHRAITALPAELRECLVLREFEDMSYRDIATVTGVPIGTVMSRLFRARRALMQAFEEQPG
jgi:RNA polymerase sigma-70 factor (ECF subfamily)